MKKVMFDLVDLEIKTLGACKDQMNISHKGVEGLIPSKDSELFIKYNKQPKMVDPDFKYEPSLLWVDKVFEYLVFILPIFLLI